MLNHLVLGYVILCFMNFNFRNFNDNDDDQRDLQVNRGRNHRRQGCGTAGHL